MTFPGISFRRFLMGLPRPSKKTNLRRLQQRNEEAGSFLIREAIPEDIPALAQLHVTTWAQTYWLVRRPPTYAVREWQWKEQFKKNDGSWFCFVIENSKKELIGFAKGLKYSHSDLPEFSGELNKIYILREYQRVGLGRRLIGQVARKFLSMGISDMLLFGEAENPSGKFHEAIGGEKLCSKEGEFHGGYCWRNLEGLAAF